MRVPLQLGLTTLIATLTVAGALAQSQPLGDVARQQQLGKQQSAGPQHVITNEDLPQAAPPSPAETKSTDTAKAEKNAANKADELSDPSDVRGKISAQKQKVEELEAKIAADQRQLAKHDRVDIGVHILPYCIMPDYVQEQRGYKDWCDEPAKLQAEIDDLQKQLESERVTLNAMQEEARRQGFGNSVL